MPTLTPHPLRRRTAPLLGALVLAAASLSVTLAAPLSAQASPAPLPPASPPPPVPAASPTPPVPTMQRSSPPPAPAARPADPAPTAAAAAASPANATPPAGATMRCKDGVWLSGAPAANRCERNGGVAVILPVRATAPPPPRAP